MADDKQGNITVDHQISRGSMIDSKNGKRQNSAEDKMRHNNDTYFAEGICNHMARKWGKEKVVGNVVKTCVGGGDIHSHSSGQHTPTQLFIVRRLQSSYSQRQIHSSQSCSNRPASKLTPSGDVAGSK